jgi:hypothetical protein
MTQLPLPSSRRWPQQQDPCAVVAEPLRPLVKMMIAQGRAADPAAAAHLLAATWTKSAIAAFIAGWRGVRLSRRRPLGGMSDD